MQADCNLNLNSPNGCILSCVVVIGWILRLGDPYGCILTVWKFPLECILTVGTVPVGTVQTENLFHKVKLYSSFT